MGFHYLDLLIPLLIGLALFGPKAMQSVARGAGKATGHAKTAKDKLMAELPMEEIARVSDSVPRIPLNTRQAVQMLVLPEKEQAPKAERRGPEAGETPAEPAGES